MEVFKELQKEIHQIAKSKGWYRKKPTIEWKNISSYFGMGFVLWIKLF